MRFLGRLFVLAATVAIVVAVVPPLRTFALHGAGDAMVTADSLPAARNAQPPIDLVAMDVESGLPGALAVSDFARAEPPPIVGILTKESTAVDDELRRRGVTLPDVSSDVLTQLGVRRNMIVAIPAGEGGTTDCAAALSTWAGTHPGKRVLVVVGPSHGRRYRRALLRVWPQSAPAPMVVTSPYSLFKAGDWWQTRTTLREGLAELEKLGLDYIAHPW